MMANSVRRKLNLRLVKPSPFDDAKTLRAKNAAAFNVHGARAKTRSRPQRLPRSAGLFAAVPLERLKDRAWDSVYPARTRLHLFLKILSRRGERPVRLTNELAAAIGLTRQSKDRILDDLESLGLVSVAGNGQEVPVVRVME
jgi:hypothetical protein